MKKMKFFILLILVLLVNNLHAITINNDEINNYIQKMLKKGDIPGLAISIVQKDQVLFQEMYGYSNVKKKIQVTPSTLFEIGSNSKAFTALAVLYLADKNQISLDDYVSSYIPWFKFKYKDHYYEIKIRDLLFHTSGIPFESIDNIVPDNDKNALEKTVNSLKGLILKNKPGEVHEYATINYDVLGLIVEIISKQSFEDFIKNNILQSLGLTNTYLSRNDKNSDLISLGYKRAFLKNIEYNAPIYRGNLPAGYIISNIVDMSKWVQIQLGLESDFDSSLIKQSHIPNRTVAPGFDGASYAYGWNVYQKGNGEIAHGGSNPNYSSYVIIRPNDDIGIVVLSNINSNYTEGICNGVINLIQNNEVQEDKKSDLYENIDSFSTAVILITGSLILLVLVFLCLVIIQLFKRERVFKRRGLKGFTFFLISFGFISFVGYALYKIPNVFFYGLSWNFLVIWAPVTLVISIISIFNLIVLFYLFLLVTFFFPHENNRNMLFSLSILSIFSGLGNAFIIMVINEALVRETQLRSSLVLYFLLGMVIYILGQKVVRSKLVYIANDIVFKKRIDMINHILKTPFHQFEMIEAGKIQAGLNNDTEAISNVANILIGLITNIVTLISCFVYLAIMNVFAFLISLFVVLFAAGLYFIVSHNVDKVMKQTRDIQNVFFNFINNFIYGFKELYINKLKCFNFKNDMELTCKNYKEKRIISDINFTNVIIVGELLFTIVIGVTVFVYPLIFKDIQNILLRNYVFVFLYMTGPVNAILNLIPPALQARISWNRINELIKEVQAVSDQTYCIENNNLNTQDQNNYKIELSDIYFQYKNSQNNESFHIGPINYEFNSGEIVFITGGNGSGKSTLAKIINGLYLPNKGKIILNDKPVELNEQKDYFSAIYSDYYLFEKLYGVNYLNKKNEIDHYLKLLKIDDKVIIKNGEFNTIKLSTGQRKRLALLISYIEDKPIYLFDEWAADQDPQFREFFYNNLIQDLKNKGKLVIVISHDDRYFSVADKIIKMEMGKIIPLEYDLIN